jgi:hypothetical protein
MFTIAEKLEEYRIAKATELLRHIAQNDPSLQELVSFRLLENQGDLFFAPRILDALWRMNRYCRPLRREDQSRWLPS